MSGGAVRAVPSDAEGRALDAAAQRSRTSRGLLYSFASLVCASLVFLLGKEAVTRTPLPDFLFYWYLFAQIGFIPHALARPETAFWKFSRPKARWVLLFIGIDVASASMFFASMIYISAPVASFASQSHLVFVLLFGVLLLGERFRRGEAAGAALILAGLAMIAYTSERAGILGLVLILTSSCLWGVNQVLVKKLMESESPWVLAHLRTLCLILLAAGLCAARGRAPAPPSGALLWILLAGGLAGPFCNMSVRFMAIREIEVTKVSLIASQHPVLVLLFTCLAGRGVPEPLKLIGGAAALAGSFLLVGTRLRAERAETP